ncbi:hypothetical protein CCYA_CCYA09G2606 [Cyanidiococcus yangmingshanensis]|nr:hypothetical protein CCYA_CCYA09G2606 [Cyanidiococcus yangmingshanensis]
MRGDIIARIAQWLANEVVVKGLANSALFQRFALRTHATFRQLADRSRTLPLGSESSTALLERFRERTMHWSRWMQDFQEGLKEVARRNQGTRAG